MTEARRLKVGVGLRLNNVCLGTSQTARQWAVTVQQRRDARKKHWEEVRRGPRPQPTSRRSSRGRGRGRPPGRTPAAAAVPPQSSPVNFAATKQLMNLINRGVLQMNSVGSPVPVNGRPKVAPATYGGHGGRGRTPAPAPGRGRAMVQIPAGSIQRTGVMPPARGRGSRGGRMPMKSVRPAQGAGAAELAAIPDLGEKQRTQLMKLLKGNNGTSISATPLETARRATPARRAVLPRPPAPPPAPPPPPPEPEKPRTVPDYCHTTTGSPDDLFSVYLSAPQQPERCFVNMQINNHCLKVRLPSRPKATGMVFAQVTRSAMEPLCHVVVDSTVFVPPILSGGAPVVASRPGPKSRQQPPQPQQQPQQQQQPAPPRPQQTQPPQPVTQSSYSCSKCSQRFPTATMLDYHFNVFHAQRSRDMVVAGTHQCPLCPQWSGNLVRLKEHLSAVHASSGRSNFTCAVCGRAWGRRTPDAHGLWLRHVLLHAKPITAANATNAVSADGMRRNLANQMARAAEPPRPAPAPARARPAAAGQFPCPQCNAVFADVSKFPDHWLKAHAGAAAAGGAGAAPAASSASSHRTTRPGPGQGVAVRQRVSAARASRFSIRYDAKPAPAAAEVPSSSAAAATPAGDGTLRCTRCGELFTNEAAYAQHWINAHTRIRLSADQQAAASRAAAAGDAPPTPPPPPAETANSNGDGGDAVSAMEQADTPTGGQSESGAAAASEDTPPAAAEDPAMDCAEPGEVTAVDTAAERPPAAAGGGDAAGKDSVTAAPAAVNGLAGAAGEPIPAPLDPLGAADLVPSDADFEMSEETLDKMLEQIVPTKPTKTRK